MDQLLTIEDVADLRQMTPRLAEQQIRADYLQVVRVGNEVRIEPEALPALNAGTTRGTAGPTAPGRRSLILAINGVNGG